MQPLMANIAIRVTGVWADKKEWEQAVKAARTTAEICPFSAEAYSRMANSYRELGEYPEAIVAEKESLRLLPGAGTGYYQLGISYEQWGKWEEAVKSLEQAVKLMPIPDNYITLAQAQARLGKFGAAERSLRDAIVRQARSDRHPEKLADLQSMLASLAARAGDEKAALVALEQAGELAPEKSKVKGQRILLMLDLKRTAEARRDAAAWVEESPTSAQAWLTAGRVYRAVGEQEKGTAALEKAHELNPGSVPAREELARGLCIAGSGSGETQRWRSRAGANGEGIAARAGPARPR